MPLFTTLANTKAFANQETPKRPAFPPTAVQLYANAYISFASYVLLDTSTAADTATGGDATTNNNAPKRFEVLSYQSSHIPESTRDFPVYNSKGSIVNKSAGVEEPNFGIWDCHCGTSQNGTTGSTFSNASFMRVSTLLKGVLPPPSSPSPIFLAVVDLALPHLVQPMLSSMISSIVDYSTEKEPKEDEDTTELDSMAGMMVVQGTTSVSKLTMTKFGKAPTSKETAALPALAEDEGDEPPADSTTGAKDLTLVLCAVLPRTPTNMDSNFEEVTYKDKQAQNLVRYHLFKYASQIQCTLAFVRNDDKQESIHVVMPEEEKGGEETSSPMASSSTASDGIKGISVQDLSIVIRRLSQNLPPVEQTEAMVVEEDDDDQEEESKTDEQQQHTQPTTTQPSIYAPGQYDTELIDSAYLRNASCPGVWNANEDDLAVALPPMTKENVSKDKTPVRKEGLGGDEEWLTRLADSVTAVPGGMMGDDAVSIIGGRSVRSGKTPAKDLKSVSSKKKGHRKKPTSDNKDVSDFFNDLLAK